MKLVELSIIICTRNRASDLDLTLGALADRVAEVPGMAIEFVIVDNGSTDATAVVIERWSSALPGNVIALYEPRPGLSVARNAAIGASNGRLLAFTDDDCRPAPGYLQDMVRHFADDRAPTIRGGRVDLGNIADLPFTIKTHPSADWLRPGVHPGGFILGCNMVAHRDVFNIIGVFDERFGAGALFRAGEETDLFYRAQNHGIPVHYVPNMAVRHFHGRRTIGEIERLNFGYHVGSGALYLKHIRHLELLRHFYWDLRKSAREYFGGPLFDSVLGLSHRRSIVGNLRGAWLFLMQRRDELKTPQRGLAETRRA